MTFNNSNSIQIILHGTVAPPKFKLIWTRLENLQIAYCCGSWTLLPPWTLKSKALYLWLWTPDFVSRMTFESFKIVCFSNVLRWVQAYITVYLLKTYELFWSPATRPFTWAPMERMWSDYKTGGRLDAATWAIWFLPLNQNRCQFQANYSNFIFIYISCFSMMILIFSVSSLKCRF